MLDEIKEYLESNNAATVYVGLELLKEDVLTKDQRYRLISRAFTISDSRRIYENVLDFYSYSLQKFVYYNLANGRYHVV